MEQVTFSGEYARERGQRVYFVTERCVLRLAPTGLEIVEIAPGLDLEEDVLSGMELEPTVSPHLVTMDPAIFGTALMGLRDRPPQPLEDRFVYDEADNVLYCNFEGLALETAEQADHLAAELDERFRSLGGPVHVIVNYDNFDLGVPARETFFAMARRNSEQYSLSTTRYSTNAFFRRRLGRQFAEASLNHGMYGSFADAREEFAQTDTVPGRR